MSVARQELMTLKAKLGADVEVFKQQYDRIKTDYAVVVRAIELLDMQDEETTQIHESEISVFDIDFTGTQNLAGRLERIAGNNNGRVNATKAAEILIEAKQSHSTKRNLVPMIYRTLSDGDRWEKVSPGTFQIRQREFAESEIALLDPGILPRIIE